jgi:hypothetical protein
MSPKRPSQLNTRNSYAAERLVMKLEINRMNALPYRFEELNKLQGFIVPSE